VRETFAQPSLFFTNAMPFLTLEGFPSAPLFMGAVSSMYFLASINSDPRQTPTHLARKHTHARNKFTLQQTRRVLFSLHFVSARRPYIAARCLHHLLKMERLLLLSQLARE
jgi:hypothetical protein